MSLPVEIMLARWPMLYPESIGDWKGETRDDEQGEDHGVQAARVSSEIIAPVLEAGDLVQIFVEKREIYRNWTPFLSGTGGDLESVISLEERKDYAIATALDGYFDELGERILRATREGIRLRGIVRRSTLPYMETWPEESWYQIGRLLADNELCNLAIIHFLITGEGKGRHLGTLAAWGFQYALDAYHDAGENGQDWVRLEDIPK